MSEETLDQTRERLILAALEHVPFDGWSSKALRHACDDLGLDASAPQRLFAHGVTTAVDCFTQMADRLMAEDVAAYDAEQGLAHLPVHQRLALAIRLRCERWAGHQETIRRAVAVYALPQNLGLGAHATWRTVDAIWNAVGDRSSDMSWYSKRASLAAVYSATLLYWLDDQSEDCAETWGFLERRLDDVVRSIRLRHDLSEKVVGTLKLFPNPLTLMPRPRGRARHA